VTGAADDGNGWRLPADRLEHDLAQATQSHLADCILRGQIGSKDAHSTERLRPTVDALGDPCLALINEAKLGDGTIAVKLDAGKMVDALQVTNDSIFPKALSLQIPFTQRRRGVETRLIIGAPQPARDDITTKYLGKMLVYAFLSPKLVRAIIEGRQPTSLTTNWIRRHDFPASWADQDRIIAQL